MDSRQFDAIAARFAARINRRSALSGSLIAVLGVRAADNSTHAQEATPIASPEAILSPTDAPTEYLFVQTFTSGTWDAKRGSPGVFRLSLIGAAAQTIYFSDRPARIVGSIPTTVFLESLGFTPSDPPNAAVVVRSATGEDILIVELTNPTYSEVDGTLVYDAVVLNEYVDENGIANLAVQQANFTLPPEFGPATLFIDDANCPNTTHVDCVLTDSNDNQTVVDGFYDLPECFVSLGESTWDCCPCQGTVNGDGTGLDAYWAAQCNSEYPDCKGECAAGVYCG